MFRIYIDLWNYVKCLIFEIAKLRAKMKIRRFYLRSHEVCVIVCWDCTGLELYNLSKASFSPLKFPPTCPSSIYHSSAFQLKSAHWRSRVGIIPMRSYKVKLRRGRRTNRGCVLCVKSHINKIVSSQTPHPLRFNIGFARIYVGAATHARVPTHMDAIGISNTQFDWSASQKSSPSGEKVIRTLRVTFCTAHFIARYTKLLWIAICISYLLKLLLLSGSQILSFQWL